MIVVAAPVSGRRRWKTRWATLCMLSAGLGACSSGSAGSSCSSRLPALLDMLPSDGEIGTWASLDGADLLTTQAELYNWIGGTAAPQYIDRGWVSAVHAAYMQYVGGYIQVAIHDMGNGENAQNIYNYLMPTTSQTINGLPNAVVDLGLSKAYAAYAYTDHFFIVLSIDQESDAALTAIELFMNDIINRAAKTSEA